MFELCTCLLIIMCFFYEGEFELIDSFVNEMLYICKCPNLYWYIDN
jgi:hypothetical protein